MMPFKSKASMQSQSQLPKVSTRLGIFLLESRLGFVWLEFHLGLGSFFSENKNLGINNQNSWLGINNVCIIYISILI